MIKTMKMDDNAHDDDGSIKKTTIVVDNPMDAAIILVTSRNGRFQWT